MATSNNLGFLLRTVFAAAGFVSEVRRISFVVRGGNNTITTMLGSDIVYWTARVLEL